jgi:hypothetical protein
MPLSVVMGRVVIPSHVHVMKSTESPYNWGTVVHSAAVVSSAQVVADHTTAWERWRRSS